jgi:hypothetical protein
MSASAGTACTWQCGMGPSSTAPVSSSSPDASPASPATTSTGAASPISRHAAATVSTPCRRLTRPVNTATARARRRRGRHRWRSSSAAPPNTSTRPAPRRSACRASGLLTASTRSARASTSRSSCSAPSAAWSPRRRRGPAFTGASISTKCGIPSRAAARDPAADRSASRSYRACASKRSSRPSIQSVRSPSEASQSEELGPGSGSTVLPATGRAAPRATPDTSASTRAPSPASASTSSATRTDAPRAAPNGAPGSAERQTIRVSMTR